MPAPPDPACPLAGGASGPAALRPLVDTVLDALADGAATRCGPLPRGGPARTAARLRATVDHVLPERGTGAHEALYSLVHALAEGAADPADPQCAAHLHCPPLAVATAADLAASALNPSLDSWDQAPAASELEALVCRELATLVFGPAAARADSLVTTGGTEANQLALLLARERAPAPPLVVRGAAAHHSVHRAAWLLGLPEPLTVPTPRGVLDPAALDTALTAAAAPPGSVLVVATAGTTDTGAVDPLPEVAETARRHGARLHVDAAYGGPLLFSSRLRHRLAGLEQADTVSFDLHKFGWQPVAAGLLAVPDRAALQPLGHRADYLSAEDDVDAGLPDLLGRSLRTTRRPDVLKLAVTLRALGRSGVGALVERACEAAGWLADLVRADPHWELRGEPGLSTVLFRPRGASAREVAAVRRRLLFDGRAVLGRARAGDGLWLKATLLNPHLTRDDLHALLKLVRDAAPERGAAPGPGHPTAPEGVHP
ncbi:aminotransferase class V-fold PLP-dependent enzyme [Streptomyces sp. AJS327]|uniref:pyridoxal phosphate-dependent decarboxylase family protein n=1 Tax=Streptomyces sp. AJS327 TaxID=2545265 RepID=UPI0015DFF261|nr:aminotransferase class V-fold PLP-dependent enzyme [Streptomyces sp. AJS327]MBA0050399.1 aminotransferase class V-fold PLP-dependent enzyme [Streptomyces sp. AJS327]